MTKTKIINALALSVVLSAQTPAFAADPLGALQALDSALKATSLVDIIAKAISNGVPTEKLQSIPRLKVIADCGDCKISNATKMLMVSSYNDMAEKNNLTINQDELVTFKITYMWARPSFIRGALGLLSGADVIRGSFEGDTKVVGEYSISHEMGIDEITQKLGENLVKEVMNKTIEKEAITEQQ